MGSPEKRIHTVFEVNMEMLVACEISEEGTKKQLCIFGAYSITGLSKKARTTLPEVGLPDRSR